MDTSKSLLSILANTTPVTLVANDTVEGNPLVTPMMNPDNSPKTDLLGNELGSIRLQQETRSLNGGSFLNARRRVAFIAGTMTELNKIVAENKLQAGSQFPGKIQVTESLAPFWPTQTPKINPNTDEQIGVTVGDTFHPVYLRMTYTEDATAKDKYIRTEEDVVAWHAIRASMSANAGAAPVETANIPSPKVGA